MEIIYAPHPNCNRCTVVTIQDKKIRGTLHATVNEDHVWLEVSPTLEDDNGHTVYRDALEGEIQTGGAVIQNPLTINGVAYSGRAILEDKRDIGKWYDYNSGYGLTRIDAWNTGLSDSARRILLPVLAEICNHLFTDEARRVARIEYASYAMDRAAEKLDDAMTAFAAADAAYVAALGDVKS